MSFPGMKEKPLLLPNVGNESPRLIPSCRQCEFIEASTWYEGKRLGLGIEFIAEIERCISLASSEPLHSLLSVKMFVESMSIALRTAFISAQMGAASLFWRYFMAMETRQSGRREPALCSISPPSGAGRAYGPPTTVQPTACRKWMVPKTAAMSGPHRLLCDRVPVFPPADFLRFFR